MSDRSVLVRPAIVATSTRRDRVLALAAHEYRAAVRSRVLLVLLAILVGLTIVSVYIAATGYAAQLADYQAYVAAAKANGVNLTAPSPLVLLDLLRGAFEYIEIIGAVIAITLGYLSISRERTARTLPLVLTRPVTRSELAAGNALGALGLIITIVTVSAGAAVLCLGVIGHSWVSGPQIPKLALAYLAAIVYLIVFYCVGVIATARAKVSATGLLVALGIWLVVVLILPQIGDTLDADNQVPGGLFAALGLGHPGEVTILSHLHTYEVVRNAIESASFEKHFERFSFAMIDVVPRYRELTIARLFHEKATDVVWMAGWLVVLVAGLWRSFRKLPVISQGGP